MMVSALVQCVLKIKHRIYIFISEAALLNLAVWKRPVSFFLKKTAVQHITVSCLVHASEAFHYFFTFFIRKISVSQCLHLVNKIFCDRMHSGKKRYIQKFKIKQINNLFFAQCAASVFHITEIHQLVFQSEDKTIQLRNKFR